MAKYLTLVDGVQTLQDVPSAAEAVNVEALSADKVLTAADAPIQIYTCAANRTVTLPTTGLKVGQKFQIWNNNAATSTRYLTIASSLGYVDPKCNKEFRWNGSAWADEGRQNISTGYNNSNYGIGIGNDAYANHSSGIGIGNSAVSNNDRAVGVGLQANCSSKQTNTVALGAFSKAERNREFVSTATDLAANKAQMTIQKFVEKNLATSGGAWQELFIEGSSARLVMIASSVYNFILQINAIDVTTRDAKAWKAEGAIKRDGSNNTSLLGTPTITVLGADAAAANWDLQITANDTNEALKIEVKHDSANNVRFSCNLFATETRI